VKKLSIALVLLAFLAPLALQANVLEQSIPIAGHELGDSGVVAAGSGGTYVNPAELRWTQTTAGGGGRASAYRQVIAEEGYVFGPIDVVKTADGLVTLDHTRAALALEAGITRIPANIRLATDLLPESMASRFGTATTWGEVATYRASMQRPPLQPTGTTTPPRLPR